MNFRRWITALAVLALFAVAASAQDVTLPNLNNITCTVASSNQTIRTEGSSERVGDVTITCGNNSTQGGTGMSTAAVDRATIVLDLGVPITSRADAPLVINTVNVGAPSEIALTIQEPGLGGGPSQLGTFPNGYGVNSSAIVCTVANAYADQTDVIAGGGGAGLLTAATRCPAFGRNVGPYPGTTIPLWVLDTTGAGGGQAANVYQGAIGTGSDNTKVFFYDVPVFHSGSGNVTNTLRITNLRVAGSSAATVTAKVTAATLRNSTGTAAVQGSRWQYITAATPTVATAQAGLTATVAPVGGVTVCAPTALVPASGQAKADVALLSFKENYATAFKTRVLPLNYNVGDAFGTGNGANAQTRPTGNYSYDSNGALIPNGALTTPSYTLSSYQSESGVLLPMGAGGVQAGLADSGTRLKAVFTGLDAKAIYYVTANNVLDYASQAATPAIFHAGDQNDMPYAIALPQTGTAPFNMETQAYAPATPTVAGPNNLALVQLVRNADGTAEAVWEVVNSGKASIDTFTFAFYAVFNAQTGTPAIGNTATVALGLAPTASADVTSAANTWIPRFAAPGAAQKFFNVLPCQTSLLFPYVTNVLGYDTGIAISNTTTDPFTTAHKNGACSMNFYGTNAPAAAISTGVINSGATFANTIGGLGAVNFQGYGIAVCEFQGAHGFAFITSPGYGGPNGATMGYLALVMDTTNMSSRGQTLLAEGFRQ